MELADLDSGLLQGGEGILRLLEFDGEMAGVVIHAEELIEPRVLFVFAAQLFKKGDGFGGIFQQPEWFRFEAEVQFASGPGAGPGNMFNAAPEILADEFFLSVGVDEFLERAGNHADAALYARGQKP